MLHKFEGNTYTEPRIAHVSDLYHAIENAKGEQFRADIPFQLAHEILTSHIAHRILLLDIRTPHEFGSEGRIDGAINLDWKHLPVDHFNQKLRNLREHHHEKDILLTYCRSGNRTFDFVYGAEDGREWEFRGFRGVLNMQGGIQLYAKHFHHAVDTATHGHLHFAPAV